MCCVDLTPAELAELELSDYDASILRVARTMFMIGELDHEDLTGFLRTRIGWSSEVTEEYVNAACDANDGDPC